MPIWPPTASSVTAILAAFPNDALLTEEGVDDEARLGNPRVWIVDPIDGTNQFVDRDRRVRHAHRAGRRWAPGGGSNLPTDRRYAAFGGRRSGRHHRAERRTRAASPHPAATGAAASPDDLGLVGLSGEFPVLRADGDSARLRPRRRCPMLASRCAASCPKDRWRTRWWVTKSAARSTSKPLPGNGISRRPI